MILKVKVLAPLKGAQIVSQGESESFESRQIRFVSAALPKTSTRARVGNCLSKLWFTAPPLSEEPLRIEINLSTVSQSFPASPVVQMLCREVERPFSRCCAHQLRAYLK